jgi:hypothetical protein
MANGYSGERSGSATKKRRPADAAGLRFRRSAFDKRASVCLDDELLFALMPPDVDFRPIEKLLDLTEFALSRSTLDIPILIVSGRNRKNQAPQKKYIM